eukprot:TRINITY_DN759_c0_g1_i1.p1 TRINITY_DN759_c0_g1~~TRINITY_DN759_c0_g1_i1.p1  ORF type:complete len:261 (-),score=30.14 TRINITY_DN759_c0_g1_i1:142-924(-)
MEGFGVSSGNSRQKVVLVLDALCLLFGVGELVIALLTEIPSATKNNESRYFDEASRYARVFRNCSLIAAVPTIVFCVFFILASSRKSGTASATVHFSLGSALSICLFVVGLYPPVQPIYQVMCMQYKNYCDRCDIGLDGTTCSIQALDKGKSCFFYDYDYDLACGPNTTKLAVMMALVYTTILFNFVSGGIACNMHPREKKDFELTTATTLTNQPVVMQNQPVFVQQMSYPTQQVQQVYVQQPQYQVQYVQQPQVTYIVQ